MINPWIMWICISMLSILSAVLFAVLGRTISTKGEKALILVLLIIGPGLSALALAAAHREGKGKISHVSDLIYTDVTYYKICGQMKTDEGNIIIVEDDKQRVRAIWAETVPPNTEFVQVSNDQKSLVPASIVPATSPAQAEK